MKYKPGTMEDYSSSMAEEMRRVFEDLWEERFGPLPPGTEELRRLIFVSIAQGVVKHLSEHALDSYNVEVNVTQTSPLITSSAHSGTPGSSSSYWEHKHHVTVEQDNSSDENKVISRGDGKERVKVRIETGTLI